MIEAQYRVYFPSKTPGSTVLWPYWEGRAGSFEKALERAFVSEPNCAPSLAVTRRKPTDGEYVVVQNVSDDSNGCAVFTAVEVNLIVFERRTGEEV